MLLVVLGALAFVVPLVYAGIEQQRFHLYRVDSELSLQKAYRHAGSMLEQVKTVLALDGADSTTDHLREIWAQPLPLQGLEEAQASAVITDDQRFWNLNLLVSPKGEVNSEYRDIYGRIFAREGIREELLDAVIDWIDQDDLVSGVGGAEKNQYIPEGFGAKNAPLESLDELLLLKGWTSEEVAALRPYFTVTGRGLNVNTADEAVLQVLAPGLTDSQVRAIVESREEKPFENVQQMIELKELQGREIPLALLAVSSSSFTARITAREGNIVGTLELGISRSRESVEVQWQKWNP